ncbi:double-strand break repair helicase AddA [Parasphingorhabdus cellanae]|uniref:DNA 3'-5' helicase n=1 Tax=Parasphingorhabdus cellanae TaxID=2806553 RepID=A0ABX7T3K1_9SPHN|nr:double-strand break repair helicase AddA [Parasphingorhabdus cellanae]QTD56116.1 double-strand break repair helicase AddA [Parasphingorhabdus cellanae]
MSEAPTLYPLADKQSDAVQPDDNIWLSASAGTGKTQVLTARVFRLLLRENVKPEHILCLTFTKAGAAEMADRIHRQLASWVRADDAKLATDLSAIGAPVDPATREYARTLFARVLDARGGGLRIMTIHSFCQTLLASFPEEAGIPALFKPIEERDQKILARQALGDLLLAEEAAGNTGIIQAIQALSVRMGEEETEKYLMKCASKADAMENLPSGVLPFVRGLLGLPTEGDAQNWLEERCTDEAFNVASLEDMAEALAGWGTKTATAYIEQIRNWIAADPAHRAATLPDLHKIWAKVDGEWRAVSKGLDKAAPHYHELSVAMYDECRQLLETKALFDYADLFAGALTAGRGFYHRYAQAKKLQGVVDFDDMIRMTAKLLNQGNMAEWIRYKLDQRTDHILVDEAQDTNLAQWDIVRALAGEFFAGLGASADKIRTLFTVGDFKQAIFGFQGTSPHNYVQARDDFFARAEASERPFKDLPLDRSFRSTPPVLEVVDKVLEYVGEKELGLDKAIPPHQSHFAGEPGSVTLWQPVAHGAVSNADDEEGWLSDEKRVFAQRLALQIKEWLSLETPLWLNQKNRPLQPKDIMILVSKRDDLSALIVARLFAENVPVAGIDRIRLNQPLVVQDLLAAIRFVLQPNDDLNLASLLVSPLLGWTQEDLLERGYRGDAHKDKSLWQYLRTQDALVNHIEPLRTLLNMADFNTPYQFLETIVSGPMQGRKKLTARLSHAALDPLEELLNTALAFEQDHIPTLQGFLDWFDRGDVEIKRDQIEGGNEVRLMTVHGAKGLQAPLVILANATFDPANKKSGGFDIPDPMRPDDDLEYPVVPVRKAERTGLLDAFATVADGRERQEHWRLLYVAMTRAEEHLVVTGILGPKAKGVVPDGSWYNAVEQGLKALGSELTETVRWIAQRAYTGSNVTKMPAVGAKQGKPSSNDGPIALPEWLFAPAPKEARPPRPLTPSDLGPDDAANPPSAQIMRDAAKRGKLLHSLFERLPDIAPDKRKYVADRWLEKQKQIGDAARRKALIDTVVAVLDNPDWSALFSPDSFAEAPIAAVVDQHVVSGTVDRLLVTDNLITVIDFKTGRAVPKEAAQAPRAYLRQMAAYVAALEKIFPDRPVKAALLYTQGPTLLELSGDLIVQHKPTNKPDLDRP